MYSGQTADSVIMHFARPDQIPDARRELLTYFNRQQNSFFAVRSCSADVLWPGGRADVY